jgi:hypothetical protein
MADGSWETRKKEEGRRKTGRHLIIIRIAPPKRPKPGTGEYQYHMYHIWSHPIHIRYRTDPGSSQPASQPAHTPYTIHHTPYTICIEYKSPPLPN